MIKRYRQKKIMVIMELLVIDEYLTQYHIDIDLLHFTSALFTSLLMIMV